MYIKQVEYVIILTNVSNFHRLRCAKIKTSASDLVFKRDTHVLGNFHVIVLFRLLLQECRTQPGKFSPFSPAAHHTLVLNTLGGGCSAVSAGWTGRRSHSLSVQRGYLWLSQTGHLYLLLGCEKHQMDTEGTGGPSPTWFNYFYFNPRPLLPLQCLVNTTF